MIVREIYIKLRWELFCQSNSFGRELARVWYGGLEESPCISVDLVFG